MVASVQHGLDVSEGAGPELSVRHQFEKVGGVSEADL